MTPIPNKLRVPFLSNDPSHPIFWYDPIVPQPDNDDLAQFDRLMLYHDRAVGPKFFVVKTGSLHAGWVIGLGQKRVDTLPNL